MTEVGKGSVGTAVGNGLADPKTQGSSVKGVRFFGPLSKGKPANILVLGYGFYAVTQLSVETLA